MYRTALRRPACLRSRFRRSVAQPRAIKALARPDPNSDSGCGDELDSDALKLSKSIKMVATQELSPQVGVQHMMELTRDKTSEQLENLCGLAWFHATEEAIASEASATAVADWLIQLSDQPDARDSQGVPLRWYGSHYWRDMPGLAMDVNGFWNSMDIPSVGPERKPTIAKFLKQVHFTCLLINSSRPVFDNFVKFAFWSFRSGLEWHTDRFEPENLDIWIPAMAVQMETAGLKLKTIHPDDVGALGYAPPHKKFVVRQGRYFNTHYIQRLDRYTLGRWQDWQKRLQKLAFDKRLEADLRFMAMETSEKMTF